MSAVNFVDNPECCVNCQSENVTSQSGHDVEIDEHDREVLVCGYKCYDCGERFPAYVLNVREMRVYTITLRITTDASDDCPDRWAWHDLIDCQPGDVQVMDILDEGPEWREG
jgi:hypothetical protein